MRIDAAIMLIYIQVNQIRTISLVPPLQNGDSSKSRENPGHDRGINLSFLMLLPVLFAVENSKNKRQKIVTEPASFFTSSCRLVMCDVIFRQNQLNLCQKKTGCYRKQKDKSNQKPVFRVLKNNDTLMQKNISKVGAKF